MDRYDDAENLDRVRQFAHHDPWPSPPRASDEAPTLTGRRSLFGRGWVRRYGGHPVELRLDGTVARRSLFVGGRERTGHRTRLGRRRPDVDVIVNLCDRPDLTDIWLPGDRWWPRGEGPFGYKPETLAADALAVADLLARGDRVLVHCVAGVNRAPTLCAAVVMLLEGVDARTALARVRQHRWMAFPDPWHWHTLCRLQAELPGDTPDDGRRTA